MDVLEVQYYDPANITFSKVSELFTVTNAFLEWGYI